LSRQSGISASLQHKGQKIFMVAIPTRDPGKAVVQVATIQVAVNDLLEVESPEPVRLFEPLLVDLNQGLKMVLHAPVVIRRLRVPGTINGGRSGHDSSPPRKSRRHLYSSFDELSRKIVSPYGIDHRLLRNVLIAGGKNWIPAPAPDPIRGSPE
jgi:hypothetical protein